MSRFAWIPQHVSPIGLDLGARTVRLLQLGRHRGQTTLTAYAERHIPPGLSNPAERLEYQAKAVQEMLQDRRFVGRQVVSAVPWEDLQIRNVRIPTMPADEVATAIQFEAGDRFGLDPSAAEIRFIIAGDVRQGTEVRQEVIVMAARRSAIDSHIAFLDKLGLQPAAVDAGACALFRSFERFLRRQEDSKEVNAFIDLGYSGTRVVITSGPNITFFKAIPIGGRRFDELVSDQMELNVEDAARLRVQLHGQHVASLTGQAGRSPEEPMVSDNMSRAVLEAIRPALEQLSKEIALCLRYCSVTFRGPRSESVTVIGGESFDADILQVLSDQVNVPFRVGKPVRNVALDAAYANAERRTGQPDWTMALGLAMKPIGTGLALAS